MARRSLRRAGQGEGVAMLRMLMVMAMVAAMTGCADGEVIAPAPNGLAATATGGGIAPNVAMVACTSGEARLSVPGRTPIDLLGTVAMQAVVTPGQAGVTAHQIQSLNFGDGFVLASCAGGDDAGDVTFIVPGTPINQ